MAAIEFSVGGYGKRLAGGIRGIERGYAGFATIRGRRLDFRGEEWLPFLLAPDRAPHGYAVQSYGMQERLAASAGRAAAGLCPALYAIDRGKLRRDASRDGPGERSARPAKGNHAFYHGKRRAAGAGGYKRSAFDR